MNNDTTKLIELAKKCIEIQKEMMTVHADLTVICRAAVKSGDTRKADRCVESGAFLVKAGDSLMQAQQLINMG